MEKQPIYRVSLPDFARTGAFHPFTLIKCIHSVDDIVERMMIVQCIVNAHNYWLEHNVWHNPLSKGGTESKEKLYWQLSAQAPMALLWDPWELNLEHWCDAVAKSDINFREILKEW